MSNQENKRKVLLVEPEKHPRVVEINDTLEAMQEMVGGLIQALYPFEEEVALICNEEGKLLELPFNRALYDEDGDIYDIVSGTFFLIGAPSDSDGFASLTDEQIKKYTDYYNPIEVYTHTPLGLMVERRI